MTVKWIVFDLGGVLVEVDFAPTITALAARTGWQEERVAAVLLVAGTGGKASPAERLSRGEISVAAYLKTMVQILGGVVSAEELLALRRREIGGEIASGVGLLRALSGKYRLACYSNSNEIHWQTMRERFALFQHLEVKMASHFSGVLKPEVAAFEHICHVLAAAPGQILLIDDRAGNVSAARSAGLHAIHFDPTNSLTPELEKYGIHRNETI